MADFRIRIIVDPTSVVKGTRVVEKRLDRVANKADLLRKRLGLTFAVLAGGALIFGAVRNVARFEEAIATAGAVTKATGAQFDALRDRALELGITTRFSATQAADALVLLSRAGFSVEESLDSVDATLKLAQAGALGVAEAADITASALRGFGLEAKQTADVTDVLVAVTNRANTNVSQLGQALKFVAPIARGLNQDIRVTSAALGVLSDAGLKATLAGTGLRRVLAELESPGRELNSLLREAGLTADEVAPSQNKLVDVLDKLKKAGIDTGLALEIFGQRGGPAFQVLISNTEKLKRLGEELKNVAGEAKNVAKAIDDTLGGALFRARSAIEGFGLAIAEAGGSTILIETLDAISAVIRFVAGNILLLTTALVALATVGVAKLALVIGTLLLPALRQLAIALAIARGGALAAATSFVQLTLAMTINPFVAVAVAAAATFFAIKKLTDGYNELGKILEQIEEDSRRIPFVFANLGAATRELNSLNRAIEVQQKRGLGASERQLSRVKELERSLGLLKNTIKEQSAAQKEANERAKRGADISDGLIERLERRQAILRAVTIAQKDSAAFQEQLNKLEDQGATPNAADKEKIRALIETNSALARQSKLIEEIKGPQRAFAQASIDLAAAHKRGAITAGELAVKLQKLRDAQAPTDLEDNSLESLRAENAALADRIKLGDLFAERVALENALRKEGVEITDAIRAQIIDETSLKLKLTEQQKKLNDAKALAKRDAASEERAIQQIADRINVQDRVLEQERLLQAARDAGKISVEQQGAALADLQLKGLEASTALGDGFSRAFAKISREAEDLAAVGEKVVSVFADNATEALIQFAETGQFKFKEFASAILKDLLRIIARLLVVQALNAAFGGGIGTLAGGLSQAQAGGGGRQEGGTVQPNTSFTVGENGPELFVPDRTGTIVPNAKDQAPAAPPIVQIINVQDPDEVPNQIASGNATDAIINELAANKERVNQALS